MKHFEIIIDEILLTQNTIFIIINRKKYTI